MFLEHRGGGKASVSYNPKCGKYFSKGSPASVKAYTF